MKKRLLKIGGVILLVLLLCTILAPHVILMLDRQEEVAESYAYSEVFFDEYEDVLFLYSENILRNSGSLKF